MLSKWRESTIEDSNSSNSQGANFGHSDRVSAHEVYWLCKPQDRRLNSPIFPARTRGSLSLFHSTIVFTQLELFNWSVLAVGATKLLGWCLSTTVTVMTICSALVYLHL